ncbi:hypothetical protein PQQ52_15580 [Paraburkholderia sediminicola]|uniref:hypothetical protein n=1 Tax=Paraburkholderia sediminicola TaxID=458836 RepID=UPI0038BBF509
MAILLLATVTVLHANAQSSSAPGRKEKTASSSGLTASKLKVPAAEMKLLGAPSDLDSGYLEQLGGPADDSATPALSMTEEPATPTEVLLAKGTGSDVTSSTASRISAVHTLSSTNGTAPTNTDLASRGVVTNPYISPDIGATVYRSPW